MDIVFAQDQVSVSDLQQSLTGQTTYSAARVLLQRLHKKGLVIFTREDLRYIYRASADKKTAGGSTLARLVDTFFDGSHVSAARVLLGDSSVRPSDEELEELGRLIEQMRKVNSE